MSLQLADLREAALREYPEYGRVPPPSPWYSRFAFPLIALIYACLVLLIVYILTTCR